MMKPIRLIRIFAALLALASLTSCQNAALTLVSGVGTGGTGITFGTVVGFGSLLVDGDTYDSATATYLASTNTEESAPASSFAVALGQQVKISLDSQGNPTQVQVEPTLVGKVTATDIPHGTFVVNGVTVHLNSDASMGPVTYLSGLVGSASITTNMQLEIHGLYGEDSTGDGYIQATRIVLLPGTNTVSRITGTVTNLDPYASTFRIGSTVVQYNGASILPTGVSLSNGQLVNVWSPSTLNGTSLNANTIRIRSLQGVSGTVVMAGLVSSLAGNSFNIQGIRVDASASSLQPEVQTLASGEYVVVNGSASSSGGALVANSISTPSSLPTGVELKGTVTGFTNSASFQLRGVAVDASGASYSGGNAAALTDGSYVVAQGAIEGDVVKVTTMQIESSPPEGSTVEYSGTVSQKTATGFVLTLSDGTQYDVTLASNIGYEDGTAAQLVDGATVQVQATKTTTGLIAYGLQFTQSEGSSSDNSGSQESGGESEGGGEQNDSG